MNAPSSESRGIECSLLELYEPNEHAPSMSAFDILRDLAKRSVTMQDALSDTDRVAPPPNPRLTSGYPRGSASHRTRPCTRTRGAKLVACAAEGGSESTREVRSTWARARA